MTPNKKQLAAQLNEAAKLLELLGDDPFKARAYGGAVRSIENFEGDFETLFEEERLTEIRGIGKGLAAELLALKALERLPVLDELYGKIPEGVRELFVVSGLGPKKIASLWRGGVTSLEDLVNAAEDGRLETHKGFSKKSAGATGEAARFALAARERLLLSAAGVYAELLCQGLRAALAGARVEIAGSLRRRLETVEGIDFVVAGAGTEALQEALASLTGGVAGEVSSLSEARLEIRLERHALRFFLTDPESFGAVLAVRTGNEDYLRGVKDKAGALGYSLSERG
ncbi:MAG: helix-hairpin-helix domain-containing protein, partial [Deinococcota bacterium]|nr:helix-hairpin-helix domain-containing protein [Deinococcota bacterium]